jgi:hypothetical protein
MITKLSGLLLRRALQGPGHQTSHSRHADVFHLGQINVQAGTLLAPLLSDDDLSPALGQFLDSLEILRRRFTCSHVASLQRDTSISPAKFYTELIRDALPAAKCVLPPLRRVRQRILALKQRSSRRTIDCCS